LTGFARKAPDISPALSGFEPHREPGLLELILGFTLFDRQGGTSVTALVSLAIGGSAAVLWPDLRFPRGSPSELIQHALPGVQTQPSIDLHRKKDEVFCLATAAAPSYERGVSKEQVS
jgi:hypothetical protein